MFATHGDVLEIAAGDRQPVTSSLAAIEGVEHITAVDSPTDARASPAQGPDGSRVALVQPRDVSSMAAPRPFDVVAFGFWLSHVRPRSRLRALGVPWPHGPALAQVAPPGTLLGVARLAYPELLVELEATARRVASAQRRPHGDRVVCSSTARQP